MPHLVMVSVAQGDLSDRMTIMRTWLTIRSSSLTPSNTRRTQKEWCRASNSTRPRQTLSPKHSTVG